MKKNPRVIVSEERHKKLAAEATKQTVKTGKKVSIAQVAEAKFKKAR